MVLSVHTAITINSQDRINISFLKKTIDRSIAIFNASYKIIIPTLFADVDIPDRYHFAIRNYVFNTFFRLNDSEEKGAITIIPFLTVIGARMIMSGEIYKNHQDYIPDYNQLAMVCVSIIQTSRCRKELKSIGYDFTAVTQSIDHLLHKALAWERGNEMNIIKHFRDIETLLVRNTGPLEEHLTSRRCKGCLVEHESEKGDYKSVLCQSKLRIPGHKTRFCFGFYLDVPNRIVRTEMVRSSVELVNQVEQEIDRYKRDMKDKIDFDKMVDDELLEEVDLKLTELSDELILEEFLEAIDFE